MERDEQVASEVTGSETENIVGCAGTASATLSSIKDIQCIFCYQENSIQFMSNYMLYGTTNKSNFTNYNKLNVLSISPEYNMLSLRVENYLNSQQNYNHNKTKPNARHIHH